MSVTFYFKTRVPNLDIRSLELPKLILCIHLQFRLEGTPIICMSASRDGFFYDGHGFHVVVDKHPHQRYDSASLYRLLTYTTVTPPPLLTKAGKVAKRQPLPHQDKPGHFYVAQLLHYGLPPLKTKNPAKKRLLAAFGTQKTLTVPEHILELERSLNLEYSQAKKITDQKYAEEKKQREKEKLAQHQKQKREDALFMQQFTDAGIVISTGLLKDLDESDDEELHAPVSNTQLQNRIAALPKDRLCDVLTHLMYRLPSVKKALIKELEATPGTNASELKKGKNKVCDAFSCKGNVDSCYQTLNITRDYAGEHRIVAPYLKDEWPDQTQKMVLKMSLSAKGSHLWARFHFGIVSGVIRSDGPLPQKAGDVCRFLWRGREEGEGEQTFGEDNWGTITFLDDGKIKGTMQWMGVFEFVGKKVSKPGPVWVKNVTSWKREWRGINSRSYEYERQARWGRSWFYDDDGVVTPNSDTDNGHSSSGGESEDSDAMEIL